ncbi:MAG: hypothetical protein KF729_08460 [Sandaracinaceae bacterium]|nr:hypothetical protein [Sandaracinaceae bacterium]
MVAAPRLVGALEALARLAAAGHVTPGEVAHAKARLLGDAPVAPLRAVGRARRGRTLAISREVLGAPGALAWLEDAVERYDVAVVTPGALDGEDVAARGALRARGLSPYALGRVRFVATKPPADVYVDPRALRFDGTLPSVAELARLAGT